MSARRSLSCDARQLTWPLADSEGDAEMWGVVCFGPFGTGWDRVGALCAASALGWVCARARAMSGRAGVRNEWAAGVGAPPKNLVLRGPLRWTTERTSSWARFGLGHGRADEEAGIGTFGGSLHRGREKARIKQVVGRDAK